jgi:hypothetical protein
MFPQFEPKNWCFLATLSFTHSLERIFEGYRFQDLSRRVKKLKLRKGGSFPTFFVLDGSLP